MKRKVSVLLVFCLMVLAGCGKETSDNIRVAYSIPGLTGPIWNAAGEGFKEQCEKLGWDCHIVDPNDNLEEQISMLDNQLNDGIDALILTAIDGQAVKPTLEKFSEQEIPVVAIDRQLEGGEVLTTVEADNYNIGFEMGEMFVEDLAGKPGEVLIIGGPLSSSATVLRTDGFKDAIESHENIKIVGESATEFDNELALAAVTNYLQSNPNINGIFSCTDTLLPAVITGLKEADKLHTLDNEDHVRIYSVDGDSFGLEKVEEGFVDATFGLDPFKWAEEAVLALEKNFNGESVENNILVGGRIVTKDNFDELKNEGVLWGLE